MSEQTDPTSEDTPTEVEAPALVVPPSEDEADRNDFSEITREEFDANEAASEESKTDSEDTPSLSDQVKELKDSVQSESHAADQKAAKPEAGPDPGREASEIPAPTPADSPDPRPGPTGPSSGTSVAELLPQGGLRPDPRDFQAAEESAVELGGGGPGGAPAGGRRTATQELLDQRDQFADTLRAKIDERDRRIHELEIVVAEYDDALSKALDRRELDALRATVAVRSASSEYAGAHEYDAADEVDDETQEALDQARAADEEARRERQREKAERLRKEADEAEQVADGGDNATVQERQAEGNALLSQRGSEHASLHEHANTETTPETDEGEA